MGWGLAGPGGLQRRQETRMAPSCSLRTTVPCFRRLRSPGETLAFNGRRRASARRGRRVLFYFVLAIKSLKEIKGTNFITWSSRQSPAGLPVPCTLDRQKHPCKGMPAQVRIDDNWCSPAPSPPPGCRLEGAEGAQRVFGGSSRPVLQEETQQAGASRTAGQGARRLSVAATQGCGSHLCS